MPNRSGKPSHRDDGRGVDAPNGPPRVEVSCHHRRARSLAGPLRREAQAFLRALDLSDVELSIALVGDAAIRRLNRDYRAKDQPTDVLSFPAGDSPAPGPQLLGDLVISLDTAARASRAHRRALRAELRAYLAHGLLHLLGYDHHRADQRRRMRGQERRLLGRDGMLG